MTERIPDAGPSRHVGEVSDTIWAIALTREAAAARFRAPRLVRDRPHERAASDPADRPNVREAPAA